MKKKLIYLLIGIVVIAGLIVYFGSRPSVGKINTVKTTERKIEPEKMVKYNGNNLSFEYWDRYTVQAIDNQNINILENVHLVGKAGIMVEVVLTLKTDTAATAEDVSGAKMRQIKSEEYRQESIDWNGTEGILFKKTNGFELTAFFVKSGKSMTLSMTANSNEEQKYREEFEKMLASVVWK